jgi:hypothetical protein
MTLSINLPDWDSASAEGANDPVVTAVKAHGCRGDNQLTDSKDAEFPAALPPPLGIDPDHSGSVSGLPDHERCSAARRIGCQSAQPVLRLLVSMNPSV